MLGLQRIAGLRHHVHARRLFWRMCTISRVQGEAANPHGYWVFGRIWGLTQGIIILWSLVQVQHYLLVLLRYRSLTCAARFFAGASFASIACRPVTGAGPPHALQAHQVSNGDARSVHPCSLARAASGVLDGRGRLRRPTHVAVEVAAQATRHQRVTTGRWVPTGRRPAPGVSQGGDFAWLGRRPRSMLRALQCARPAIRRAPWPGLP
jgi:hypothetical protein